MKAGLTQKLYIKAGIVEPPLETVNVPFSALCRRVNYVEIEVYCYPYPLMRVFRTNPFLKPNYFSKEIWAFDEPTEGPSPYGPIHWQPCYKHGRFEVGEVIQ